MKRRVWLKQLVLFGGALLFLPGCVNDENVRALELERIVINDTDENLLAEIGETIIPEDETSGSKSLNLHQFVLKMFDDCYSADEQKLLIEGLKEVPVYVKTISGGAFEELAPDSRIEIIEKALYRNSAPASVRYFLTESKRWIVKGFQTSEYVLTKITPYELVPGRFHGCAKTYPAL